MAINFNNCKVLGINYESRFLGEVVRYSVAKQISLEGVIRGTSYGDLTSNVDSFLQTVSDYQSIDINGTNFGTGTVKGLVWREDNEPLQRGYSATIEIQETGDFSTLSSSPYYNGLSYSNFQFVTDISENFTYTDEEGKSRYNHSLNLTLTTGVSDPLIAGKAIATNLFQNTNLTGFFGDYTGLSNKKKYYTESYNSSTNQYSWSENVEFGANDQTTYSHEYTLSAELNDAGIVTASENGQVKGIQDVIGDKAQDGYDAIVGGIFARITGNIYTGGDLYAKPITKSKTVNWFEGTVDYSQSYTNDPRFGGDTFWDYTITFEQNDRFVWNASEKGQINGTALRSSPSSVRYDEALAKFTIVTGGIAGRLSACPGTPDLRLINKSINYDHINGNISYSYTYARDETLSDGEFKKCEIDIDDTVPTLMVNRFNIPTQKEVIQPVDNVANLLQRMVNLKAIGTRVGTIDSMLTEAKSRIGAQSIGSDSFIQSVSYGLSRRTNEFTMSVVIVGTTTPPALENITIN